MGKGIIYVELIKDFKAIFHINMIANNPITIKNIKIAQQIFGEDIGSCIGKTTTKQPQPSSMFLALLKTKYANDQVGEIKYN